MRLLELGLATSLGLGAIYTLIAISYTLILSASGVFNFAQAAIVSTGAMASYYLWRHAHIPIVFSLMLSVLGGAVLGVFGERIAVRRFYNNSESLTRLTLVSTLGLGLAFSAVLSRLAAGTPSQPVPSYLHPTNWYVGQVPVRSQYVLMFGVAVVLSIALHVTLQRTEVGLTARVAIEDAEGARLLGIRTTRLTVWAFALGGAIAALAGALVAPITNAYPTVGDDLALYGFAAMAIGGYGNFRGAAFGGLLIGLIVGLAPIKIDPSLTGPLVYGLVLAVLLARPAGLFGAPGAFGAAAVREV
jgi:branched-chain amino acid transport system permease protein